MIRDSPFRDTMPQPFDDAWAHLNHPDFDGELGGSTGARLIDKPEGRFVEKRGAHPQHILNEFDMNRYLNALGVGVPDATMHDGPAMHTRFEERAMPLDLKDRDAVQRVRQDFVPHAAIGNWDALGLDLDNVLIRPDGTPTYVDVGGSGPFRAQGGGKGEAWSGDVGELESMQHKPPHTESVFGGMSGEEMGRSWDQYGGEDAFNQALQHLQDTSTRNVMQQRIADIARRVA